VKELTQDEWVAEAANYAEFICQARNVAKAAAACDAAMRRAEDFLAEYGDCSDEYDLAVHTLGIQKAAWRAALQKAECYRQAGRYDIDGELNITERWDPHATPKIQSETHW
jgi:hypothetical protein